MSISKEVNIDILNEVYALSAFHGLREPHPDDQWNEEMTEEAEGYLPNIDLPAHGDETLHDGDNSHLKANPAVEAMQRAAEARHVELAHQISTNGTNSNHNNKPSNLVQGHLDHDSLTRSNTETRTPSKSIDETENHENDDILDIPDTSSHRAKMTKAQVDYGLNFIYRIMLIIKLFLYLTNTMLILFLFLWQ